MSTEPAATIERLRAAYADDLCILAHHYQDDSVVRHADAVGDSLELARGIPGLQARHIVLCGVTFMAETAAILAREGQAVFIPSREAGCPLADMARPDRLDAVLDGLNAGQEVIPLAYVNSSAGVKAVCGRRGGSVCTSANAAAMLQWALEQAQAVLFLPDGNLGENSADRLGLPPASRRVVDIQAGPWPEAGVSLYLWPGYCHVHQGMRPEHIRAFRSKRPEGRVIVHPECPSEVVALADASGSTSQIIRYVEQAPPGSSIAIGTEAHLVGRLAKQWAESKEILRLCQAECPDMAAITEEALAALLEDLSAAEPVTVEPETAAAAKTALDRMLRASVG